MSVLAASYYEQSELPSSMLYLGKHLPIESNLGSSMMLCNVFIELYREELSELERLHTYHTEVNSLERKVSMHPESMWIRDMYALLPKFLSKSKRTAYTSIDVTAEMAKEFQEEEAPLLQRIKRYKIIHDLLS